MSNPSLFGLLIFASGAKNQHPGVFVAIFLVMGLLLFIFGFKKYAEYRILRDTPRAKVRSIPMGLVHLQGKAVGEKCLTSPLTRQPCFYYQVKVEKWVKKDKDREGWENYATDKGEEPFYLDDSTGKVRVNPARAEYDVTMTFRAEVEPQSGLGEFRFGRGPKPYVHPSLGVAAPTPQELRAYLQGQPGQASAVLGQVAGRTGEVLGKVIDAAHAVSSWGNSKERFRFTEHCLIADRACNILGTCAENPSPQDEKDRNLIQKGQNEPSFVISDKTEIRLEKDIFRNALIMILLGGGFLIAAAVALSALGLL
jgi:E3 Ubiquitin ligase